MKNIVIVGEEINVENENGNNTNGWHMESWK